MLFPDKRQKSEESCALYGLREHALMFGTRAGMPRIDYFCLRGYKPLEQGRVFIVDILGVL